MIVPDTARYSITGEYVNYINIESCVWAPAECELLVGFYNISTGECTTRPITGGDVRNKPLRFSGLDIGTYWVCVINKGSQPLTSGIILLLNTLLDSPVLSELSMPFTVRKGESE